MNEAMLLTLLLARQSVPSAYILGPDTAVQVYESSPGHRVIIDYENREMTWINDYGNMTQIWSTNESAPYTIYGGGLDE